MLKRHLKISERAHTGKIRRHEHTSYLPLAILLIGTGLLLTTFTTHAWERPGPASGSVGLTGTVPAKPPTTAAVIKTPTSGQRFGQTPVTISGSCPKGTIIELFKNDIFAGSTPCTDQSTFSIDIDLMIGENRLVAHVYDALNQAGPESNTVVAYYDALTAQAAGLATFNFGGQQLLLNTDAIFRGTFPEKEFSIPVTIIGGRAPYAVNVQWGDSTNTVVPRPDNATFRTTHTYKKAGTYQLSIQATDADGRVAFLTVASIVNGQPDPAVIAATETKTTTNTLLVLWPLYVGIFCVVISFWIGEWRERRVLIKHGYLATS